MENNKDRNSDFIAWNESMAKKYNPETYHNSRNFLIRWIEKRRVDKIIKLLDVKKTDEVIELGCGAGNILEKIRCKNLVGVDLSDFLLGIAKQKFKDRENVELIKGNIEDLAAVLSGRAFSKLYCSEVLEHVKNPDRVISEIMRISRPGAVIVISIPNESLINKIKKFFIKTKLFDIFFPRVSKKMDDEWHLHAFDLALLREYTEGKLNEVKVSGAPFGWFPLRYIVKFIK